MPKNRKTDKYRLIESRGSERFEKYKPWLKVHEFGSKGRVHRIIGWKNRRIYQLMSDLELYYFLLIQWDDNVIDIREQYPLLPLEDTLLIANELGITHPPLNRKEKTVMTTDFVITYKKSDGFIDVARAIKISNDLENKRTINKLLIEKNYWDKFGMEWGLVTENEVPKVKAINIYSIYNHYFWAEEKKYDNEEINLLVYSFKNILKSNNFNLINSINEMEKRAYVAIGEGLNFFKYLLITKKIKTDMDIKFNFSTMKVWF